MRSDECPQALRVARGHKKTRREAGFFDPFYFSSAAVRNFRQLRMP